MRTPLIVANWKMNHGIAETLKFMTGLKKEMTFVSNVEIVICPPFTSLYSLSVALSEQKTFNIGAQNCHWEKNGAFTGEISPLFLKELECDYVLLGHSERRHVFGETNEMIQKKTRAVLDCELKPIVCIGEKLEERESKQTLNIIGDQLTCTLKFITPEEMESVTIAYEPVWAIGTGLNATPGQAEEVHLFIRNEVKRIFGEKTGQKIRLLYGGSVKADNAAQLMKETDIDGLLVGGASLTLDSFMKIVQYQKN
ncbi:MAG: hypothetical protein ACD_73C00133G0002 [uncultured bacterium]|nr:MAG: hypothetical protein ACD_73C00133G0002 [uncultured bacterium]